MPIQLWTLQQKHAVKGIAILLGLYIAYQAIVVVSLPPPLRVAKIETLKPFRGADPLIVDDQIAKIFPLGITEDYYVGKLAESGLKASRVERRDIPRSTKRLVTSAPFLAGPLVTIMFGSYELRLIADFEHGKLTKIRGLIFGHGL